MDELCSILSANLKQRRKALGMTQAMIAESLGYSEKAISKWESGKGLPPTAVLPQLARLLEVTLDELLTAPQAGKLYLGIDGGGTKTALALANERGEILRELTLGPSNPNDVGLSTAKELLRGGITKICEGFPRSSISLWAGLAGGSTAELIPHLQHFFASFGFAKACFGSDAQNAVSAGLGADNGIAVIMGTGSVAFAKNGENQYRIGGYGYLLGDGGSGFAIGRAVIEAALRFEDGSGDQSALYPLVLKKCGTKTVLESLGAFYQGGKSLIAAYAPLLFEALEQGDAVASAILQAQMQEIATLIEGGSKHLTSNDVRVVLCGGLARANARFILPVLRDILKNAPKRYEISICNTAMTKGALYLAGMPQSKEDTVC